MNYNTKMRLIKFIINLSGWCTILFMFLYMMPIVMTFQINVYGMSAIVKRFIICMISYYFYLSSINKVLNRYNKINDLEGYKNYIKEMIDIRHTLGAGNTLVVILVLFFVAVIITYALWWWKADLYIMEAIIDYFVLVLCTTINGMLIAKYAKNFKYFDKRLHDEVYK